MTSVWSNKTNATLPHHQGSSFHKTVAPQIYATYLVSWHHVSPWSHRGFPTHVRHSSIPFQGKHHEEFFPNCKDLPATGELSRVVAVESPSVSCVSVVFSFEFVWYQKMNKSSEPLKGENKLRNTFQNQSVGWFLTMEAADRLRNTIPIHQLQPAKWAAPGAWLPVTASCEIWSTKHTTYGSQKASRIMKLDKCIGLFVNETGRTIYIIVGRGFWWLGHWNIKNNKSQRFCYLTIKRNQKYHENTAFVYDGLVSDWLSLIRRPSI